jgi:hypothetical protein
VLDYGRGFILIGLVEEPFRSIRLHVEVAPRESDIDIVLALLPSLFAESPIVCTIHVDHIEAAAMTEHGGMRDEVMECLRLKLFGNLVQQPHVVIETGKYTEMKFLE